jgi:hypothetical protein
MIIFFIFLAAGLALLHFVYEGILAPSFRLHLRFRLFALRDELRRIKVVKGETLDGNVFAYVQEKINVGLKVLSRTDIELVWRTHMLINENPALANRIERRIRLVRDCPLDEIISIDRQVGRVAIMAFTVNSGMWAIYVVPLILAAICLRGLVVTVKKLLFIPEGEVDSVLPPACEA